MSFQKKENRIGSKTAPIEKEETEGDDDEYLSTYNYYVYYNSIKPHDPRLKKPTYTPKTDIDFIRKGEKPTTKTEKETKESESKTATKIEPEISEKKDTPKININSPYYNTKVKNKEFPNDTSKDSYNVNNYYNQQFSFENENNNQMNPMFYQLPQTFKDTDMNNQMYNMNQMNQMYTNPNLMNMAIQFAKYQQYSMYNQMMHKMPGINTNQNLYIPNNKRPQKNSNKNIINFSNQLENLNFDDILKKIVPLCKEPNGSRFIQKKYENCSSDEKDKIIEKIIPEIFNLSIDIFGNYVIQRIMECSSPEKTRLILDQLHGNIKDLSLNMYGCRVVQKALDLSSVDEANYILKEIKDDLKQCIEDQNGNHVVQKLIEKISEEYRKIVINIISGKVFHFSKHQYGCRVIQRIYDYSSKEQKDSIIEEILNNYHDLIQDQYGNYVIQKILNKMEKGTAKNEFFDLMKGNVYNYSVHKFASNVLENCLCIGNTAQNKKLIDEILLNANESNDIIMSMVTDKYGNYVIQKMIEVANYQDKKTLIKLITSSFSTKKRDGFSKHVLNFIEKLNNLDSK